MSDYYVGEIRLFAGRYVPVGWVACDGQTLSINTYQALYSLIGTTYGGDGQSTFGVPDLRGRLALGTGQYTAAAPDTSVAYTLGQSGGAESVTLLEATMPNHTHALAASTAAGTLTSPAGNLFADTPDNLPAYVPYVSTQTTRTLADDELLPTGGSQPHENRMPAMALRFIMATDGIYPMQG